MILLQIMDKERKRDDLLKRLNLRESWVIFFILGIIMLNYPLLAIFNKPEKFAGIPILLIYIFGGWLISIIVIFLFTLSIKNSKPSDSNGKSR